MSARPACPTPAPVPLCRLHQARSLQPHHTRTGRYSPHYVVAPTHLHCTTPPHMHSMYNTITTGDSLRTVQVQRCQRHQVAQRRHQCHHALCIKAVACNHTTHAHSVTARITSPHQHTSTAQPTTYTPPRPQRVSAYVPRRTSDVSDTRLPNAGASAAMPSAPSLVPAKPHHARTECYSITLTNTPPVHKPTTQKPSMYKTTRKATLGTCRRHTVQDENHGCPQAIWGGFV